ncbi:MAG: metalloregulator ArsR/SmtB family transcription factor [Anaerolineales bacterium]
MSMSVSKHLRDEINQLHAQICSGLADPTRIVILYALHGGPLTVSEIVNALELPQPTVSRHLKVLREAGLVVSERYFQRVQYRLKDGRVIEALNLLREILANNMQERAQLINNLLISQSIGDDEQ